MNHMNITNKDYEDNYQNLIFDLFKKTLLKETSKTFWDWRFKKNPFGKPLIRLSFHNTKLVAQYLLHPINLEINQVPIKALFSMMTMTHPDYKGRGIMTKLAKEAYDIGEKNNYSFVVGFANKNSRYMFTKKLNFKELKKMTELVICLPSNIDFKTKTNCSKIDFFDDSFLEFYKTLSKDISMIMIPRTPKYLNWRFIENPDNDYECYKIHQNKKLVGYFVLKNYMGKKGHIIDFLIKDNIEVYNSLIEKAIDYCNLYNLPELTLWSNPSLSLHKHLIKLGFYERPTETYFIIKNLSNRLGNNFENFENWYITMGDSDNY